MLSIELTEKAQSNEEVGSKFRGKDHHGLFLALWNESVRSDRFGGKVRCLSWKRDGFEKEQEIIDHRNTRGARKRDGFEKASPDQRS